MQNFINDNYSPDINYYNKYQDPNQNESFNKATHPSDKPIISKHIFAIDSRQRDYKMYPNSNNYNLPIPDKYRNVTGIELKAAMLPRTEYNVNSTNKYLDISIGDYISNISIIGRNYVTNSKKPYHKSENVPLKIDSPYLGGIQAEILVDIDGSSSITNYKIINAGSGYSCSNPPKITLGDNIFNVKIGKQYISEMREGQYVIGGNPQFTNNENDTINVLQSWVPTNLLCEIENCISNTILENAEYCYSRKSWTSEYSNPELSTSDYPLLFTCRLMSQYPSVESYEVGNTSSNSNNYGTNCCKFNRIYISNSLIFKTDILPNNIFKDDEDFEYTVLKYDTIVLGNNTNYILYCKLNNPLDKGISGDYWDGLSNVTGYNIELAHWEFLFATGENQIVNSATLLGYNKKNYYISCKNSSIDVNHATGDITTLIPKGLTYSAENDYYLYGDPEYITLSFKPKYGGSEISGINDRVDSQPDSNIDRVFACLIYDTVQPAVLQDISSGKSDVTLGSLGYNTNNLNTYMNYDNNFNNVKQLTGNSGSQNVSYNKPPGQLKAMKGADFDKKLIEFPQPVAQIYNINIRFTKFTKQNGKGTDAELYDFHGKEHLLLFEITCGDLMTGKRF